MPYLYARNYNISRDSQHLDAHTAIYAVRRLFNSARTEFIAVQIVSKTRLYAQIVVHFSLYCITKYHLMHTSVVKLDTVIRKSQFT